VTLAQQSAHLFSLGFALCWAAAFHQFRREVRAAQERAEAAISLAQDQRFPSWLAFGSMLRGWALAQQGQAQEGIEQINQGLIAHCRTHRVSPYLTLTVVAKNERADGRSLSVSPSRLGKMIEQEG